MSLELGGGLSSLIFDFPAGAGGGGANEEAANWEHTSLSTNKEGADGTTGGDSVRMTSPSEYAALVNDPY